PIRTRGGCSYGFGGSFWFCCRSTAPVRTANAAGTDWRLGQAPIRTRGGCSYGGGGRLWLCAVGAPPRCEPRTKRVQICVLGRHSFAPGAGAPTGSRAVLVLLYDDPFQESKLYVAGPG